MALALHPNLNPAIARHAELMTDGAITDALLHDVAAMQGLPLLIEPAPYVGPSVLDLAEREFASATADHLAMTRLFAGACRSLGESNRRLHPPLYAGGPRTPICAEVCRRERSHAMRWLNSRRALVRKALKRLEAARAALAALAS